MTKPLSYLFDRFKWRPFKWDIQRNDETSGSGDGRVWQAALAPPLWVATVMPQPMKNSSAEEMDALIRALRGASEAFLFASPLFCAPKSDPGGAALTSATVQVNSVAAGRDAISLKGLPAGFVMSAGDKLQIGFGSDRNAFLEVSAGATANGAGITASMPIFPNLPTGIAVNAAVTLLKPACKVIIVPGSYKVGTITGGRTDGGNFQVIQKK